MENQKPYSAVLYLRSGHTSIYAQALALHRYCEHQHIIILQAFFETEDDSTKQPERSAMAHAIFSRSLKPDLLLFTSLEVFAEHPSDALNLHYILAMHGVAIKAIL